MRKTKYFAMAALAAIAASCSNDNESIVPVVDNTKDTPITIASAGVAELTTRSAETNPLVGTSDSPATMGVFVTGGNEAKYDATNVQWKHAGTSWENQETTMLYEGTGSQQKIYAYSPYSETTATADGTITVTATDQKDWLVATSTDVTGSSVSLTMTHALAKLVLIPTFGTDVTDQTITSVKVDGMYASGTLNISDNTWALGENPTIEELTMDSKNELLVIPMTSCEDFIITVVTGDDRKFETTIDLTDESIGSTLAAGTQYNIYLQVGQDKVTVGGITASPWTSQNGGELETF